MKNGARSKLRANGDIYRALYIELDEETYQRLLQEKKAKNTTYARVITDALHSHLLSPERHTTTESTR